MKSDEANKEENNRLKKIVADQAMVVSMLKEIAPENGPPLYRAVSPSNGKKKMYSVTSGPGRGDAFLKHRF